MGLTLFGRLKFSTKDLDPVSACMCLWAKDQVEGSWQAPGDVIISLLCSASCSGFLCSSTSCSRLRLLSTGLVQQRPGLLCRRLPARPTPVSDNCVLPTLKHSLSVERAAFLETGPLPLQDHKSETVCRPISDYVGCHMASSGCYWRHLYSDREATVQCELFLTVPYRNILTYLFTYLRRWLTVLRSLHWVSNSINQTLLL